MGKKFQACDTVRHTGYFFSFFSPSGDSIVHVRTADMQMITPINTHAVSINSFRRRNQRTDQGSNLFHHRTVRFRQNIQLY